MKPESSYRTSIISFPKSVDSAIQTFAGIANQNEFCDHHYLAEVFQGDIKALIDKWNAALIAWENEAFLALKEKPGQYEIVAPSLSILAEPPVTVIDKVVDKRGTREVATAYLEFLYSDIGQDIAGKNGSTKKSVGENEPV